MIRTDDRACRIVAHATRPHLVEAEVAHLARAVAVAVDLVHKRVHAAPLARPVRDIGALAGENLSRASGLHDLNGRLDAAPQVSQIIYPRSILDPGRSIPRRDAPARVAQSAPIAEIWCL